METPLPLTPTPHTPTPTPHPHTAPFPPQPLPPTHPCGVTISKLATSWTITEYIQQLTENNKSGWDNPNTKKPWLNYF